MIFNKFDSIRQMQSRWLPIGLELAINLACLDYAEA